MICSRTSLDSVLGIDQSSSLKRNVLDLSDFKFGKVLSCRKQKIRNADKNIINNRKSLNYLEIS